LSGRVTSTIKTSQSVSSVDTSPQGIVVLKNDTGWCGSQASKYYITSGKFTSTIKDSLAETNYWSAGFPYDISADREHTYLDQTERIFYVSGQFGTTIKDSLTVTYISIAKGLEVGNQELHMGVIPTQSISNAITFGQVVNVEYSESVSNSITFTQTAARSVLGSADNSIAFGQIVNVIVERNVDNAITFGQVLVGTAVRNLSNAITFGQILGAGQPQSGIADNDIAFGQTILAQLLRRTVDNTITFGQEITLTWLYGSVSNAIAFGQTIAEQKPIYASVSNDITFGQNAHSSIRTPSVSNTITFIQSPKTNIIAVSVSNAITFAQTLSPAGSIYNISLSNDILFTGDRAGRTYTPDPLVNTITFDQYHSYPVDNTITFGQTLVGVVAREGSTSVTFGQSISLAGSIYNKSVSNAITFTQTLLGYESDSIKDNEYDPRQGTLAGGEEQLPSVSLSPAANFTLYDGTTTITLRNPVFGNTERMHVNRVANRLRGGEVKTMRDSIWPRNRIFTVTFNEITRTVAQNFLDFLQTNLGLEITITDHEGRAWDATILNPGGAVSDEGGINDSDDCRHTIELEYIGVLQ
jgi:hypothetical protein